jgi:hypothetical protein
MNVQQELMRYASPDDDEHLWTSYVIIEKRSEWKGCGDGAQAVESERRKPQSSLLGVCSKNPNPVSD